MSKNILRTGGKYDSPDCDNRWSELSVLETVICPQRKNISGPVI